MKRYLLFVVLAIGGCHSKTSAAPSPSAKAGDLLVGHAAMGDWASDAPGVRRKITVADLPAPGTTDSAENQAHVVDRPPGALPRVPDGYRVALFADRLSNPRMARVAPNGDLFVVESEKNRVRILRDDKGRVAANEIFAEDLKQPFGIAFYPQDKPKWVYVANTDSIVRFAYTDGDLKARGKAEEIYGSLDGGGKLPGGGHWTRDIVFSKDGTKLYVSIGSKSNVSDDPGEARRARIFELTPDGKNERVYASGIRNPVGLAIHPDSGELFTSVNERDELGDDLVPDYITSVRDGGFYGWPWFYIGNHQDPRHAGKHPELADKVIVPDVLLQSHSASLGMIFPIHSRELRGSALAAEHGSWNRARRTGYKIIRLPFENAHATGEYIDFMTGFVTPDGKVWGRPVAIAEGNDGTLYVTDDGGDCVWRVMWEGR